MLGISMLAYREYGEPPEYKGKSELLLQLYRKRAAQCLHSGDIAKCLPYTVETLRLNAVAEGHRRDDNQRGLWISKTKPSPSLINPCILTGYTTTVAGIIVRTAINMGYHCEPPPTISTFQSEYRRRIWSSVISMDEIFSFLGGFPYMTPERYSDTAEPRNLHDWELAEDMTVLPPSRPLSEPTSVTYQIAKSRLARALGRIADFNWNQGSYESLVEIDRALQQTYLGLPSQMKFHLAERDNAACTMADWANLSIHVNYLKGTCTLHRRSLTKARVDARYTFSRDRCISAALDILALQQRLPVSFYKVSQVRQIFALGAMVLLLELGLRLKNPVAEQASDVILQTLERACVSWAVAGRKGCDDTSKVYQLLSRLLSAFQTNSPNSSNPQMMQVASLPDEEPVVPPWLEVSGGGFMSGYETSNADFDWVRFLLCLRTRFASRNQGLTDEHRLPGTRLSAMLVPNMATLGSHSRPLGASVNNPRRACIAATTARTVAGPESSGYVELVRLDMKLMVRPRTCGRCGSQLLCVRNDGNEMLE